MELLLSSQLSEQKTADDINGVVSESILQLQNLYDWLCENYPMTIPEVFPDGPPTINFHVWYNKNNLK